MDDGVQRQGRLSTGQHLHEDLTQRRGCSRAYILSRLLLSTYSGCTRNC